MAKVLTITAKRAGFRRCGIAHPDHAVDHPIDRFSEEEIRILKAEPNLVVFERDIEEPKPDAGSGKGKGAAKD